MRLCATLRGVRILVSNDDGIAAPGLHALASALRKHGEVSICAPEGPRSGASSALTLYTPLMVTTVSENCWSVSGNPADAVKLALNELLSTKPDIIVSGINNGLNTGANVLYSGTVAAALEGAQAGITSFAVSRKFSHDDDFRLEAKLAADLIVRMARRHPRTSTVFNINIPHVKPRGVQVTPIEPASYVDKYDRRADPRGRVYYWLRGTPPRSLKRNGHATDNGAIAKGFITITPLRRNLTDERLLEDLGRLLDRSAKR
jgi:5'-nucleotidase